MVKKLASIAVVVRDTKKAKEWYTKTLGFDVKDDMDHWVTVAPKGMEGTTIHLCQTKPLEKGNTGIRFTTKDVKKTHAEMSAKGVKFTKKPKDEGWGIYAQFSDLDGNTFWLMEE